MTNEPNSGLSEWQQAALAEIDTKIAKLEAAREVIIGLGAMGVTGDALSASAGPAPMRGGEIASDAFFGLSIPDAARKFLKMTKRKQSAVVIARALEQGGYTHSSTDFGNTVRSTIGRAARTDGDIVKVGKDWGLAEWYPGMRRPTAETKSEPKPERRAKKGAKKAVGRSNAKEEPALST